MAKPRSVRLPFAQAMARSGKVPQNRYAGAKANAISARLKQSARSNAKGKSASRSSGT